MTERKSRLLLLFEMPRPRPRRIMMHVADAGDCGSKVIQFKCGQCGHDTGWIVDERTVTENRRGMACPKCNGVTP